MTGLEEIEEAIDRLPPEDVRRFAEWLRSREIELQTSRLDGAYREMARNTEREREALEWSEGLIGDLTLDQRDAPR